MKTALLISTYNWPDALDLVLKSIMRQSVKPDELLIADDGSREETKLLIEEYQKKGIVSIKHFWQEDKGFRKSAILNKAVAQTNADYIIQVDGDCILHAKFVEDHINAREKNTYLYGARVNILPQAINAVFEKHLIDFGYFSKEIKNKSRALHIPFLSSLYKSHASYSDKFRGCNVSFWRKDFMEINGYNEDYEGWGREDSDLVIRMGNKGVLAKRLRYAGIVFHIHHKINSRDNFDKNDAMQNETIANKVVWIENGVSKYL